MKLKELRIGELTARIPVIQGGMGVGISLHRLAGAVAAEGGIGIISTAQIGFRRPEFDSDPIGTNLCAIKEEVEEARKLAKGGIVGVNIMVATRKYEEYVKAAIAAGVDLIISGAGLPVSLPEIAGAAKTKLAPIVSSLKSAQVICRYWKKKYDREPDMVVIEGPQAGGHLGFTKEQLEKLTTEEYDEEIRRIAEYIHKLGEEAGKEIPVVAAGGIYQREDAERVFGLGADGVQMATRFVTTHECDAPMAYKQAYLDAKKDDIVLTKSPVGMPGRAIRNAFLEKAKEGSIPHGKCHMCVSTCEPQKTPYCITEALINAAEGRINDALLFCGTNAYRADKIEYVHDIMQEFA
ncbi:MAG: nitronate monooxygenase [Lachnospiraceae bacterium]|nr:nitronate monooxygenase [Lachnospiraceae bacterium]